MNQIKSNKNKGYAILFTVVIVSIISMITVGLSNSIYKQMIISSVAKDSTVAFYQADIASECALYAESMNYVLSPTWNCGGKNMLFSQSGSNYYFLPENQTSSNECFNIFVEKQDLGGVIETTIEAKGYNICKIDNLRTVERAIMIKY